MSAEVIELTPAGDTDAAVDFLDRWHGEDRRVVITIHPESKATQRRDFAPGDDAGMRRFIDAAQGRLNVYTLVNISGPGATSPTKTQMRAARALHIDADFKDTGNDPEALLTRLRAFDPPPGLILFSGGGYWPLWLLEQPYDDGDWRERIERICDELHKAADADPTCRNVNRLMRLPGTVNVLSKKKRAEGRTPELAYVVEAHWDRRWSLEDQVPTLPEESKPLARWAQQDLKKGDAARFSGDRSALLFGICCEMVRAGRTDEAIVAALLDPESGGGAHVREKSNPRKEALRQAQRARKKVDEDTKHKSSLVESLNAVYAVTAVAGKVAILREYADEQDLQAFALMSSDNFKLWLANLPPIIKKDGKIVAAANYWLQQPDRRQYAGIAFMPEKPRPGWYNLWQGLAVEPRPGRCDLFLAHLRDNVAQGDEALFRWVEAWLADIVQHPGRKCGTSLVLKGDQGVGKTIVGKTMGQILGRHYVLAIRDRYITGQFNSHLIRCLLLHADESFWAGDKQAEGVLKDLVTGNTHLVEFKGFEPISVRNYIRLLVTSNNDWVVPSSMEERRFATLVIGKAHIQDRKYFADIENQLEDGGYEALLDYLLKLDISKVDLGVLPVTAGLLEQKLESLDPIKSWWQTTLREGQLPAGCGETNTCPVKTLYQRYLDHAEMTHTRSQRASPTKFGIALRKLMPLSTGGNPKLLRYKGTYLTHIDAPQKVGWLYQLPSLTKCQQQFETLIGQKIDEEDEEEVSLNEINLTDATDVDEDWEIDNLPSGGP